MKNGNTSNTELNTRFPSNKDYVPQNSATPLINPEETKGLK